MAEKLQQNSEKNLTYGMKIQQYRTDGGEKLMRCWKQLS